LDELVLSWTNPRGEQITLPARQLLQEGKVGVHELFNLLRDCGVPEILPTDGAQTLLIKWSRERMKKLEEIKQQTGLDDIRPRESPAPITPDNNLMGHGDDDGR
jgi:hypothetical protein